MSSKRRIRRQACGTKKLYATKEDAAAGIGRIVRKGLDRSGWLRAYQCAFCGGWHFGHTGQARV